MKDNNLPEKLNVTPIFLFFKTINSDIIFRVLSLPLKLPVNNFFFKEEKEKYPFENYLHRKFPKLNCTLNYLRRTACTSPPWPPIRAFYRSLPATRNNHEGRVINNRENINSTAIKYQFISLHLVDKYRENQLTRNKQELLMSAMFQSP